MTVTDEMQLTVVWQVLLIPSPHPLNEAIPHAVPAPFNL